MEVDYPVLIDQHRIGLPAVHLETDFSRPLRYGDSIEVEVSVIDFRKTSITYGYRVFKKGESESRIEGHNVTVCLDMSTFTKREIPDWLHQRIEAQTSNSSFFLASAGHYPFEIFFSSIR